MKANIHSDLVDQLREIIVAGEFEPGVKIPEKQLCERYGVSRTPMREALKVLAAEGHVELLPNRGAQVAEIDAAEVRGLFSVAGSLEALAGEECCDRITDEKITAIATLHARMLEAYQARKLPEYYALNRQIHEELIRGAHNPVLEQVYARVNSRIRRIRFATPMDPGIWDAAVREHAGMLNSLERRDGASLANILKNHLRHKCEAILRDMAQTVAAAKPARKRRAKPAEDAA
ncbi:MAG: GntR family transcriptional regulator [Candidatus Protistobacter heckmanni]|nr:GntR family transcriptional regulator [Candidatus Protistobacter heckmanni]